MEMYHDAATNEETRPLTQEDTPSHMPAQMMVTPAVSKIFPSRKKKMVSHFITVLILLYGVDITYLYGNVYICLNICVCCQYILMKISEKLACSIFSFY